MKTLARGVAAALLVALAGCREATRASFRSRPRSREARRRRRPERPRPWGAAPSPSQILARNPLYNGSVSALGVTLVSAEVNAKQASFGQPTLQLTPVAGALAVHAEIPRVDVVANAHDTGGIPYSITGHVTADRAIVDAQVVLSVQNGLLTTTIASSSCHLVNFGWGLNGFPSLLTNLATSLVKGLLQDEVAKQVQTVVPGALNQALAGLAQPFTQTVLGAQIAFSVTPSWVVQDAQGLGLDAAMNVAVATLPGHTAPQTPGSFFSNGAPPTLSGPSPGFLVAANQDLMNRMAHATWKSGLMEVELSNQPTATFPLPGGLVLDGAFLQTWLPELRGKFPAGDPVALVVSPRLPPIFVPKAKPDTLEAGLGELEISFYDVAPGTARQLLVTIATHLRVTARASVTAGVLKLGVSPNVFIDASLAASPLAPALDATAVSNLLQFSLPPVLQILASTWSGFALPSCPGLNPSNLDVDADGRQKSFITIKGDL